MTKGDGMNPTGYETVIRTDGGRYLKHSDHRNRADAIGAVDGIEKDIDFVDDHCVLDFRMRKGEDARTTLVRCLPAYWSDIRTELGGPRAHEIKPIGYTTENGRLLVACRCPQETLRRILTTQISDVTRRMRRMETWNLDETIAADVLDAVHLATWPEGPAAIESIIKALDEMEAGKTPSPPHPHLDARTGKPVEEPSSHPKDDRRVVVFVSGLKGTDRERRMRGVQIAADLTARRMSKAGISLGVVLSGTSLRQDAVLVCLECSANVQRCMIGYDADDIRVMGLKDPTCADSVDIEELKTAFQKRFMDIRRSIRSQNERGNLMNTAGSIRSARTNAATGMPTGPQERAPMRTEPVGSVANAVPQPSVPSRTQTMIHGFLNPESFRTALWQGMMSHGGLSAIAYLFCLLDFAAVDTVESIIMASLLMNMIIVPLVRRWTLPASTRIGFPLSRLGPSLLTGGRTGASEPTKAVTGAMKPKPALTAPAVVQVDVDDDETGSAWETILSATRDNGQRIRVRDARTACDRLIAMAKDHEPDAQTATVIDTIGTTLPRLADDLVRILRHSDEPERTGTIESVVGVTEHLARSADAGRRSMLKVVHDRITTTITYIESKTGSECLSALETTRSAA